MNLQNGLPWGNLELENGFIAHDTDIFPFEDKCILCQSLQSVVPPSALYVRSCLTYRRAHIVYWGDPDGIVHQLNLQTHPLTEKLALGFNLSIRVIQPDFINLDVLRGWYDHCEQRHDQPHVELHRHCRTVESKEVPYFKCIDCITRNVGAPPSGAQYIALSNVWGDGAETSFSGDRLPFDLPCTIEDAITTTLKLHFRYLWIDRYCIDQSQIHEVSHQVKLMDRIYKNAELTIVVAAGYDPYHGLPDVGERHRIPQSVVIIGDLNMFRELSSRGTAIYASA